MESKKHATPADNSDGGLHEAGTQPHGSVAQLHDYDRDDSGDSSYGSDSYDSLSGSFSSAFDSASTTMSELGSSFNDGAMTTGHPINSLGMPSAVPTYPDGEFEDDKADMIANLMKNHANLVTSSLVERSNLISSITWLSHHVPECVLKYLFKTIVRARKKKAKVDHLQQKIKCEVKDSHACSDTKNEEQTKSKTGSPSPKSQLRASISLNEPTNSQSLSPPPLIREKSLPVTKSGDGALLFVDISGFTKLSVTMDVESLSNAINSYFQMIVKEIVSYGGDILKFAGDAMFAEWKVSRHKPRHDLQYCVTLAANCGAAIVANCSDYAVLSHKLGFASSSRRTSLMSRRDSTARSSQISQISQISKESAAGESIEQKASPPRAPKERRRRASTGSTGSTGGEVLPRHRASMCVDVATLNVKCGIGAGHIVGTHVGDDFSRREYLILGEPIGQVARAEACASHGEVFASPEAVQYLAQAGKLNGDWEEAVKEGRPMLIADRDGKTFDLAPRRESSMSCEAGSMLRCCDDLDPSELAWLKKMISLYVHPVVVNDDNERSVLMKRGRRGSDYERHLDEAELRNVYTCFITPHIDYKLTGDEAKDQKLFNLLNDIMNLTTRELDKVQGHLRQFILDDKGLVLIGTFGLRGSTSPNMIANRALPFSLSIHKALDEELGVRSKVGATFGKVYCGVVGGLERHEFAALGPSVNLAARLMTSKDNPGILVDKNVRLLTSQVYFKPLPAVKAKGYDDPVPIFEPIRNAPDNQWGHVNKKNFVGRAKEVKKIMHIAKDMLFNGGVSRLVFVSAMSGTGKSTLIVNATELVRAMVKKMDRRIVVSRYISNEGDSRVPFSLFRSIFKDILSQVRVEDEEYILRDESKRSFTRGSGSSDFSIDAQWEDLSLHTHSTNSSTMSTDANRFRFICQELNAPPEFLEVVGKRLLGLREKNSNNSAANAKPPNLQIIVDFMADAFVRCTKHANLVLIALDDAQWMDDMSWKVVQAIFERGTNVLIICGSRETSSYPLTVDPEFWSDLHGQYQDDGRYSELSLEPFNESGVKEIIAKTLKLEVTEIDSNFSRSLFTTSGGMPHYLSYALDAIKRNTLTVRLENGMIGMKNSTGDESKVELGSVSELLVFRLDALDSSVRTVLHLSAVLGMEFDLLDAALIYEDIFDVKDSEQSKAAVDLRASFDVAVEEGILEEAFTCVEEDDYEEMVEENEDDLCRSLGNITISLKGRKAHPFYSENRRIRFTHDSWRLSILSLMLHERILELHESVATFLERELDNETEDLEKQIRVFKHWKSCSNFVKAASLALDIGRQLMLLGLNSQAILLFDEVLDILKEMTSGGRNDVKYGGISASVLQDIDASELEYLMKLNISKGKAYATLRQGGDGAEAYQGALDILNNSPCAADEGFDRSVSFPIFSGLFAVLKMGAIEQDAECSYEKDLCKKFVEQARLNGDPVHYGRALAMEAETLGRLGNFEQGLEVVERIKAIYNIESQHAAICKAYGSDRLAQAFTHSVNFNNALGRTQAALDMCDYIVEEIVPKSDPKNIHNTYCLVYAVIFTLKENGLAMKARDIFQTRVVDPFQEHFGPGGSTYSKPMFKPVLTMLDLQGRQGQETERIDEYTAWALDENEFEKKLVSCEMAWAAFSASPKACLSEICFSLAKRQEDVETRSRLIQKAISLMEQSVAGTASLPYSNMYARKKLEMMKRSAAFAQFLV